MAVAIDLHEFEQLVLHRHQLIAQVSQLNDSHADQQDQIARLNTQINELTSQLDLLQEDDAETHRHLRSATATLRKTREGLAEILNELPDSTSLGARLSLFVNSISDDIRTALLSFPGEEPSDA